MNKLLEEAVEQIHLQPQRHLESYIDKGSERHGTSLDGPLRQQGWFKRPVSVPYNSIIVIH